MYGYISIIFCNAYKGEQLLPLPIFFLAGSNLSKMGPTLNRKNLLPTEQILTIKTRPKLGRFCHKGMGTGVIKVISLLEMLEKHLMCTKIS